MATSEPQNPTAGWRVVRRTRLIDDRWLRVDREDIALPNGGQVDGYFVIHQRDFAIVFAVTEDDRVLLVRQYKHGIGEVTLELPAGFLEENDDSPQDAIRRELAEETGYLAAELRSLGAMISNPTRSTDHGHVFLATGCRLVGPQRLDPAERIAVELVPLGEIAGLVSAGAIAVESSIAAIFLGLEALRTGRGRDDQA